MQIDLANSGLLARLAIGKQHEIETLLADPARQQADPLLVKILEGQALILILLGAIHAAKAHAESTRLARPTLVVPPGVRS